ncbi:carbon-nitrogen hydrolase family protein [Gordonia sp. L191]|uniref:carbon-nitrogen hydrolase family protein n=1 Tax=Gordonia sp. L191 TaxID=2982699 RepID=UPI0024BF46C6|nr:carbon-nitrogen hydrolase family protein [Gordonia sp. L191]WHU48191.1 carbon-nitrogen hydrolase family protein [Gordonia sp. L191]
MTDRSPDAESPDALRLALWQCAPTADSDRDDHAGVVAGNLERLERVMAEVAGRADLLITPEMFLCGYNIDATAARARADEPDGPIAQSVARLCSRYGLAVLYGCAECVTAGQGTGDGVKEAVYNTIRLVDADGMTIATHHKTHLFGDLDAAMVTAGATRAPVVDFRSWRMGMLICYEVEFPEMVRDLAIRGADLICVPTANMPDYDKVQQILLPARALENQVYLAYANYVGSERDLVFGGLTEMIGPGGTVDVSAGRDERVVIATADRDTLRWSRETWRYLADRRPELY